MVDGQARRWRDEPSRLGGGFNPRGARDPHMDWWHSSASERGDVAKWSTGGYELFHGYCHAAGGSGRRSILVRGGAFGAKRIVRHLWRMCFGLFIATGSFFLGQQKAFPVAWRGSPVWFVPALLPLVLLIYWAFRVWLSKEYKGTGTGFRRPAVPVELSKQTLAS